MSTTTFTNGITLTDADWFNDVDASIYQGTFPAGITSLAFTGATTLTVFAGATTLLTLGGTGATSVVAIPGTLDATSTTAAGLKTAGGLGVAKAAFIGGLLNVAGAGTFQSNVTVAGSVSVVSGQKIYLDGTGAGTTWIVESATNEMAFYTASTLGFKINGSQIMTFPTLGATTTWVASDKYVVIDSNGVLHRSATGPAS